MDITTNAATRAEARGRDFGFTTLWDHANLWLLDPKTGEVLRRPGETRS